MLPKRIADTSKISHQIPIIHRANTILQLAQRINDNNNSIITLRDQLNSLTNATTDQKPQIEREMAITLQQFTTTSRSLYQRALLLNRFVLNFQEADPLAAQYATEEARRKALELPVPIKDFPAVRNDHVALYQTIRGYTKDVQQLNLLFYGAITAYVLPVLYAILGAAAYTLRSLSQQLIARTYIPSYVDHARFPAAVIAGLVVGLFTNFTQSISLSPLAIAFLVGYGVEIFFSFLDAFLDTLKKVRSR
jgi:hypothetical protein